VSYVPGEAGRYLPSGALKPGRRMQLEAAEREYRASLTEADLIEAAWRKRVERQPWPLRRRPEAMDLSKLTPRARALWERCMGGDK
jgi:hypothetical protein